jgi:HEPN domain-containing protein
VIGYFLRGVKDDHILVFRSDDPEELLQVIQRLGASRNKQMRALAQQLEINWNESQYKEKRKN